MLLSVKGIAIHQKVLTTEVASFTIRVYIALAFRIKCIV
jgi:hypothetical protein